LNHKIHKVALIYFFSQTPVYTARPRIQRLVHCTGCVCCWYSAPTCRWMARLSWPDWWLTYRNGLLGNGHSSSHY